MFKRLNTEQEKINVQYQTNCWSVDLAGAILKRLYRYRHSGHVEALHSHEMLSPSLLKLQARPPPVSSAPAGITDRRRKHWEEIPSTRKGLPDHALIFHIYNTLLMPKNCQTSEALSSSPHILVCKKVQYS